MGDGPRPGKVGSGEEHPWARLVFWVLGIAIPALFLARGVAVIDDYGETNDERPAQIQGEFYYYEWPKLDHASIGDKFPLDQPYYGPLFDVAVVAFHDVFYQRHRLFHNPRAAYHFPILVVSALQLLGVLLIGRSLLGRGPGLLAVLFLALTPAFVGYAQQDWLDPAATTFIVFTLLAYEVAVRRRSLPLFVLSGVCLGLTYATKINALAVPVIVGLWVLAWVRPPFREWPKLLLGGLTSLGTAFVTVLAVWPFYRTHSFRRFAESYTFFKNHEWNYYTLYLGEHVRGHDVPWHYPFVMLGVTVPAVILGLFLLATVLSFWRAVHRDRDSSSLGFLLLWAFFTPAAQAASGAPMYDGVRHYLVSLPPIALLAGFGAWWLVRAPWNASARTRRLWLGASVSTLAIYLGILALKIKSVHPYEAVYYNELVGGIRGASGRFDLDCRGYSYKEAAEWIWSHYPTGILMWVTLPSDYYFPQRDGYSLVHSPDERPDLKVTLMRGMLKEFDTQWDYLRPPQEPVFSVRVDGADLTQVFELKENREAPDGLLLPPGPTPTDGLVPGLLASRFESSAFRAKVGETTVLPSVSFACGKDPLGGKVGALRLEGLLRVERAGPVVLRVAVDDLVFLSLEGRLVLKAASMTPRQKTLTLANGFYRLGLDYMNVAGQACLTLEWSPHGGGAFSLIPPEALAHVARAGRPAR